MQWEASATGGFTSGAPWLPLVDPETRNVADQATDPGSLLSLYQRLIAVRRDSAALARGSQRSIFGVARGVLGWLREAGDERVLVLVNLGNEERRCDLHRVAADGGEVLVATSGREGRVDLNGLEIGPREGLLVRLS
jgi:alpha-glucosidase